MPASRPRILCVEDHEDTCFMLSNLLELGGYECQFVNNIGETLRLIEDESFDLFIIDKQLPDGSGLDLCGELSEKFPGTPVIVYAATAYESDQRESFMAGATDYVAKPGVEELLEAIARQFQRIRSLDRPH